MLKMDWAMTLLKHTLTPVQVARALVQVRMSVICPPPHGIASAGAEPGVSMTILHCTLGLCHLCAVWFEWHLAKDFSFSVKACQTKGFVDAEMLTCILPLSAGVALGARHSGHGDMGCS